MEKTGSVDVLQFLQYGVLGLVIVAALMGWIWFKPGVDNLLSDRDRLNNQLDMLNTFNREVVIPAITQSNELMRQITEQLWRRNPQ